MELEEKLIRLRKGKGLTQSEVAEIMNVSRQAVSKWESGTAMPSTENLRGLSGLYKVPADYLLSSGGDDTAEMTPPPEDVRDDPGTSTMGMEKVDLRRGAIALIVLILAVSLGILIGASLPDGNKGYVHLEDSKGEDISGSAREEFHLEWQTGN